MPPSLGFEVNAGVGVDSRVATCSTPSEGGTDEALLAMPRLAISKPWGK